MKNWKIPNSLSADFIFLRTKLAAITKRAYFTGGFVRDNFLGKNSTDIDIEIYDISLEQFDSFAKQIGAKGVGKAFFVYKYKHFDLSLPRVESKIAIGHRGFEVSTTNDTYNASKRRDFTINSMMVNIFDKTMIDHFGGIGDIQAKSIKIVDPKSFMEDSLRVLRAVQFSARFGFRIESDSLRLMQTMSIDDLSKERIFAELEKFFDATHLHVGLYYLCKLGLDRKIFGTTITKKEFFYIALNYRKIDTTFRSLRFLYLLSCAKRAHFTKFVSKISAPNSYARALKKQKKLPKKITQRWLGAMSIRVGIDEFIANYGIKNLTIPSIKIDPQAVIADGFSGSQIKEEIKKREKEAICQL
jgi:tRNA nucleotidyltransferase (CCA-adding enzyme)